MELEERLILIERALTTIQEEVKRITNRLNSHEDEIERVQKDIQVLGENCKIEVPCFQTFENSLTRKLIKERDEATNTH